MSNNHR
jgi:hypothetical protein